MISPLDLNSWSSGSPVVILLFLATTGTTLGELGAAKPRPGFFQGGAGGAALGPFRRLRWPAVSEEQSRVANVWNEWSDSDEGYVYAGIYSPDEISRQVKSPKSKGPDPMRRWFGKLHPLFLTNLYSKSQPQNLYKLIETVRWRYSPKENCFFCCVDGVLRKRNRHQESNHTVDGRNPAPFGMYKTLINHGIKLPTSTGEFTGSQNRQQ